MSAPDTTYCCEPARKSMFIHHAPDCRVWTPKDRRDLQVKDDGDIGQGEGCEGGKCLVRPKAQP